MIILVKNQLLLFPTLIAKACLLLTNILEVDVVRNFWDVELLFLVVEVIKAILDTAVSIVTAS